MSAEQSAPSSSSSSYRPLLPATASRDSSSLNSLQTPSSPPPPPLPPSLHPQVTLPPKRQTTAAACEQCRRRKSKCDGLRPACSTCHQRQLDCSYEVEANETRRTSMKRKIEALEGELRPMSELYDLLRSRSEQEAQDILRRIRSSSDLPAVLGMVKDGDLVLEWLRDANSQQGGSPACSLASSAARLQSGQVSMESETSSTPTGNRTSAQGSIRRGASTECSDVAARRRPPAITSWGTEDSSVPPVRRDSQATTVASEPVNVDAFVDHKLLKSLMDAKKPVFYGVAEHWTRVTSNDCLISHLLDVFYTYRFPMVNSHDKDIFLEDFKTRNHTFCSPLLVNIILANAAKLSTVIHNRNSPWSKENPSVIFFEEAKRYLAMEDGKDSLTTLQASFEFVYYYYSVGQDKLGDRHLYDTLRIANSLQLFRQNQVGTGIHGALARKTEKVRALTAWCAFESMSVNRLVMQLEPLVRRPPRLPMPYEHDVTNSATFFRRKFELSTIESDICVMLYGSDTEGLPQPSQPEALYQRLLRWHDDLPPYLLSTDANNNPHYVVLLCRYQEAVIATFRPFTEHSTLPSDTQYYRDRATSLTAQAMSSLTHLTLIFTAQDYRCSYGYHFTSTVACSILSTHESLHPHSLPSLDPSAYASFTHCLRYLGRLGKFEYTAQIALRVVQDAAEKSRIPQTAETWDLFHEFDGRGWVKEASEHVWSSYPTKMKSGGKDGESARVDELLKQWERVMRLEDALEGKKR